jgi:hypothetical protein
VPLNYPWNRQTDNGEGLSFNEDTGFLAGADDPSVTDITLGVSIPVGVLYLRTGTTEVYQKNDTGATDWVLLVLVSSSVSFSRVSVTTATYTILPANTFIGLDTTTNSITLTLPLGSAVSLGQIITIKDETTNARRNQVSINTAGSDTIEGGETEIIVKINDFSIDVQWTGNEWSIV